MKLGLVFDNRFDPAFMTFGVIIRINIQTTTSRCCGCW
ncbi:MAG: hypothetical protein PCFJNLEI_01403 [Verrucomicrobiae bacterium]|nr:hypothetical protein [Verrucomicrobiae bacterium]